MSKWMVKGFTLENYLQGCRQADMSNFKRDYRLTAIFEHCSIEIGRQYILKIKESNPAWLKHKWTNDLTGGARRYAYDDITASPSTLQYIGVMNNLVNLFGPLSGKKICEIGGGYGGQAKTIYDMYTPLWYHIIDLPEVCELQQRYLTGLPVESCTYPSGEKYDLVISNYALSEISDPSEYICKVLMKSKHGYITCNTDKVLLPFKHNQMPDIPGERSTNYILTW